MTKNKKRILQAEIELNRQDSSKSAEKTESHIYDSIDSINQEHAHMPVSSGEGQTEANVAADVTSEDIHPETVVSMEDVCLDAAPMVISSNKAYGCPIKKVDEGHTYTNVNLFEATTLFYMTSDGTRTYRPPEPIADAAVEQITSDATADGTPQAITQLEAKHCHSSEDMYPETAASSASPEAATSSEDISPEAAISSTDISPKSAISLVDTNLEVEDECPIPIFSNEAYGCDIEIKGHNYENVDLDEATTLFYTTSDGTRTYRPRNPASANEGEPE